MKLEGTELDRIGKYAADGILLIQGEIEVNRPAHCTDTQTSRALEWPAMLCVCKSTISCVLDEKTVKIVQCFDFGAAIMQPMGAAIFLYGGSTTMAAVRH